MLLTKMKTLKLQKSFSIVTRPIHHQPRNCKTGDMIFKKFLLKNANPRTLYLIAVLLLYMTKCCQSCCYECKMSTTIRDGKETIRLPPVGVIRDQTSDFGMESCHKLINSIRHKWGLFKKKKKQWRSNEGCFRSTDVQVEAEVCPSTRVYPTK